MKHCSGSQQWHFKITDNSIQDNRTSRREKPGTGSNHPDGAVQITTPLPLWTVEPCPDMEPGGHRAFRNLCLRAGMAAGSTGRGHDASAGARPNRLCEALIGEWRQHAKIPLDSSARGTVQHETRTKQYFRLHSERLKAAYTPRIHLHVAWYWFSY